MGPSELRHLGGLVLIRPTGDVLFLQVIAWTAPSAMATGRSWASLAVCHGHQSEAAPPL
jgi:hypothetical protein